MKREEALRPPGSVRGLSRVPRSLTVSPLPSQVRVCSGPLRAGRGPRQVTRPSRCARRTDLGWPPPPRPLTLGGVPPHLTLPRRGSPAEPAAPQPPSGAGRGRGGRRSRTRTGAPAPPAQPLGPAVASAGRSRGRPGPGRGEAVEEPATPPLPAVGRGPGSGSTSDSAGRGGAETALLRARALGWPALWVARAQRHGQEAPGRGLRGPNSSCLTLRAAERRAAAGPGPW